MMKFQNFKILPRLIKAVVNNSFTRIQRKKQNIILHINAEIV